MTDRSRSTTGSDVQLLRDMAVDSEDLMADLDETKSTCKSCGLAKYDKFDEHIVANSLKRIPARLKHCAELLENVQKYGRVGGKGKNHDKR